MSGSISQEHHWQQLCLWQFGLNCGTSQQSSQVGSFLQPQSERKHNINQWLRYSLHSKIICGHTDTQQCITIPQFYLKLTWWPIWLSLSCSISGYYEWDRTIRYYNSRHGTWEFDRNFWPPLIFDPYVKISQGVLCDYWDQRVSCHTFVKGVLIMFECKMYSPIAKFTFYYLSRIRIIYIPLEPS